MAGWFEASGTHTERAGVGFKHQLHPRARTPSNLKHQIHPKNEQLLVRSIDYIRGWFKQLDGLKHRLHAQHERLLVSSINYTWGFEHTSLKLRSHARNEQSMVGSIGYTRVKRAAASLHHQLRTHAHPTIGNEISVAAISAVARMTDSITGHIHKNNRACFRDYQ